LARKSYVPDKSIVNYMNEKLQFEKERNKLSLRGEALQTNPLYSTLKKRKVDVLDRVFRSMANIVFFFDRISTEEDLREDFEDDVKDLLGVRRDNPEERIYGFIFYRLVSSILIERNRSKKLQSHGNVQIELIAQDRNLDVSDFSLNLNHFLQQIVRDKVRSSLPTGVDMLGAQTAILNDFDRALAWTGLLAHSTDQDNEKPDRTLDL
jgi:hypothetical protein